MGRATFTCAITANGANITTSTIGAAFTRSNLIDKQGATYATPPVYQYPILAFPAITFLSGRYFIEGWLAVSPIAGGYTDKLKIALYDDTASANVWVGQGNEFSTAMPLGLPAGHNHALHFSGYVSFASARNVCIRPIPTVNNIFRLGTLNTVGSAKQIIGQINVVIFD